MFKFGISYFDKRKKNKNKLRRNRLLEITASDDTRVVLIKWQEI